MVCYWTYDPSKGMESLEHRSKAQGLQRRYHVLYWFMLGLIELGNLHAILYTYFFLVDYTLVDVRVLGNVSVFILREGIWETKPEINRCNLSNFILQLKALGIDDIVGSDFIDKQPSRYLLLLVVDIFVIVLYFSELDL